MREAEKVKERSDSKASLKRKFVDEMIEYAVNTLYLAFLFGVFIWYRRLILAEYGIPYLHYGMSIIKALILAKVLMLGDMLRLSKTFETRPLIIPTIYNAVVFSIWVGIFSMAEHTIGGLLAGKGLEGGFRELEHQGKYEVLGECLVIFFALIPFFAFKELGRKLSEGKIWEIFFRKITPSNTLDG